MTRQTGFKEELFDLLRRFKMGQHMKKYDVQVDDSGTQRWYLNGQLHREDGPAVIWADGNQEWYRNGLRHREDGPALIYANGNQEWFRNDRRHREGGPAMIWGENQYWYRNGQPHRKDGPAVILANGTQVWYRKGVKLTEKQFKAKFFAFFIRSL